MDRRPAGFKAALLAPKPNLSLNVGIKEQSGWVFAAVAATGILLEAGVIALAGTGA